jgi:hypothetical protein
MTRGQGLERASDRLLRSCLAFAAIGFAVAACSPSGGAGASTPPASAISGGLPAGYVVHTGTGFTLATSPDWRLAANPAPMQLQATNTSGGQNWELYVEKELDIKPAAQSFEDYAAAGRAACPGAVPDTLVVPAGMVFVCKLDVNTIHALDYRLPVANDVWHLTINFKDGKYSGKGQDEAETILKTLVLTP